MGSLFKIPGGIIYFIGGLWGFVVCMGIIIDAAGFWGAVAAFFLLPITTYVAPLYAGFANDNWFPAILVYGSTVVGGGLYVIGSLIDKD